MNTDHVLKNPDDVNSPGLLFYRAVIQRNLDSLVQRAGSPDKLRPHVKTHKTREIVRMQLKMGITKHKCATIAEAEMLAQCEVPDVLLAYPLVGPNTARFAKLLRTYPGTRFSVTADHELAIFQLAHALNKAGVQAEVLLDLDVGQHRTGIAAGPRAEQLYQLLDQLPGVRPGGLHVYDGHNHQNSLAERQEAVGKLLEPVMELRANLLRAGLAIPRIVFGGTPTFPVYAAMDLPGAEYSPGTCVLNDAGYGGRYLEMTDFGKAALLLTRVISRPTPDRVTFDLGYKAVASDPPAGSRCVMLDMPEAKAVLHNEEHLVIETPHAEQYKPGDVAYAVPTHICPTSAMHQFAYVVEDGEVVDRWPIVARDRALTI
jgi:D-serine deaminase-like pyridoxal phosphate-dependent protein